LRKRTTLSAIDKQKFKVQSRSIDGNLKLNVFAIIIWSKIPYVVWLDKETVVFPVDCQPILRNITESVFRCDAKERNFGNVTREKNLKTEAKRIKAPINTHWTVREL
jgi:hypothetical protein